MNRVFPGLALGILLPMLGLASPVSAQCMLANPSFEIGSTTGEPFGGWYSFGPVALAPVVEHGSVAAQVSGPGGASWEVAGVWQPVETAVGEQWVVTVRARQDSSAPLTGESIAMVNVEWRDAAEGLIDYESYAALSSDSPTDVWRTFQVVTQPAPAGAVTTRLLLAVLEAANEPSPTVYYDSVTFLSQASPTLDEQQWTDFPGGRAVDFAGYTWRVKGDGFYGPGPCWFEDDPNHVWVDTQGALHLTISQVGANWTSTEVTLDTPLGYGDYVFTTRGSLDSLDPSTVLGMFLWQYGPCWDPTSLWWNPYDEIDIEFSRWNDPTEDLVFFTAQPYDWPGNQSHFDATFGPTEISSHAILWRPDRIEYRSWRGGPDAESPTSTIHAFTYTGPHIPRPEQPRVHINLWSVLGQSSVEQEAVLTDFRFVPVDVSTAVGNQVPPVAGQVPGRLLPATPNPFNPSTTIHFELEQAQEVELVIYDLAGRRVRSLVSGFEESGDHLVEWDGRDDRGNTQSTGVYLCRLKASGFIETTKLTLLK